VDLNVSDVLLHISLKSEQQEHSEESDTIGIEKVTETIRSCIDLKELEPRRYGVQQWQTNDKNRDSFSFRQSQFGILHIK